METAQFLKILQENNLEEIEKILATGFHPDCYDEYQERPLHYACRTGNLELTKLLLKYGAHNGRKKADTISPLMVAIQYLPSIRNKETQYQLIQTLLESGHLPDSGSTYGTPLIAALHINDEKCVDMLLNANANLETRNNLGQTPLTVASYYSSLEIIKKIIKRVVSFSQSEKDLNGKTVLMYASETGNEEAVQFFLDMDLDPNDRMYVNTQRNTALIYAVEKGHTAIVQKLLEAKADANIPCYTAHMRELPLSIALYKGHIEIANLLLPHTKIEDKKTLISFLRAALFSRDKAILDYLLKAGEKIDFKEVKEVALIEAVTKSNPEMASYLLEKGADVNTTKSIKKYTPLMIAIQKRDTEMIHLLLQYKPDITIKSLNQQTAIKLAVCRNDKPTVETLLKQKPLIDLKDISSQKAIQYAASMGYKELLEILKKHQQYMDNLNAFRQRMAKKRALFQGNSR